MFNLSLALQKAGRQVDALPLLERVATLTPDDATILPTLGATYEQAGRPSDAVSAYTKFLSMTPDAPDASAVKARLTRLQGASAPAAEAQ
jgi:regulator of sirC expression with transglutaminase-like and TPR domain